MLAIISLLFILALSILITRIATIALVHTGLSRDVARLQSRSAFTGVGFTTSESESIVKHPVRRRIVSILMLLGNVGLISTVSTLIIGFVGSQPTSIWLRLTVLCGGIAVLWLLSISSLVDRWISVVINWALDKWTDLYILDYSTLLHLSGDYRVSELKVESQDWLANKPLSELQLNREGIVVLGIQRSDQSYLGAPQGETEIEVGDLLILYGRNSSLKELDERRSGTSGDISHEKAVKEQEDIEREQKNAERRRKQK